MLITALQAGGWGDLVATNWIGIVVILAMAGMAALMILLARAPDPPTDHTQSGRSASRTVE